MLVGILLAVLGASPAAALAALTDEDLRSIPSPGDDFDIHTGKLLAPILIPRVPGTEGSFKTQKHFVDFFKSSLPLWELAWQNSTCETPLSGTKKVPFSNLIFSRDPPGSHPGDVSRLTLVAHFDTLIKPEGFVGAIDSAAPCAMLMHVARSIDAALTKKWKEDDGSGGLDERQGVQILFLDGEEAFKQWSATDSLYGARSLAEEWEMTFHPALSTFRTPLESISLFVLLDLLGSPDPSIPSYFLPTHWTYRSMAALEARMRALNLLESKPAKPFLWNADKEPHEFYRNFIEDDHVPFMQRGVNVLHIIPDRFPAVWHKIDDDGDHLDLPTTRDWARIVTAFVVEFMELGGLLDATAATSAGKTSATGSVHSKRTEL
ncbi:glutaminyl cyclase, putative [Metarhizium acridum CQMa 102]|uniref:Peptide hydrolase n=2 Tax=Metarhizium acridum TaxID=92637 RepID=E9EFY8_METAQ|nr:glutaminyl cyclase, putative [Metarhizium acridum CQMa 102]EFY85168.1 glutaminyl cyclase, putative [Metarhizium acridum CQMa 102]